MNASRVMPTIMMMVLWLVGGCELFQEKKSEVQTPPEAPPAQANAPQYPYGQIPETTPPPAPTAQTPPPVATEEAGPVDTSVEESTQAQEPPAKPKPKERYAQPDKKAARTHVVKKGDTLQKISMKYYNTTKNWQKIYQANKKVLKNPDDLKVGQKLIIP